MIGKVKRIDKYQSSFAFILSFFIFFNQKSKLSNYPIKSILIFHKISRNFFMINKFKTSIKSFNLLDFLNFSIRPFSSCLFIHPKKLIQQTHLFWVFSNLFSIIMQFSLINTYCSINSYSHWTNFCYSELLIFWCLVYTNRR